MEKAGLRANLREKAGTGTCHELRRNKKIPGVIYGRKFKNLLVEFSDMDINSIVKDLGEHAVLDVDVNGRKIKTMIKEVQRDPVNRNLTHVDMKYIEGDDKVHADIPIQIKGENRVRSKGGIVQKQLITVTVETAPDKLPKYVVADVSNLNIGQKLTLADMEFSEDITVLSDIHLVIASVVTAKEKETMQGEGEVQSLDEGSN